MPRTSHEPHGARLPGALPCRTIVGLVALAVAFAGRADGAVLCQQKRSGRLAVRATACARSETPADLTPFVPTAAANGGLAVTGNALVIAPGGVATGHLADGAVTSAKLGPGARTAAGSVVLTGGTGATTPTKLDSFTVNVPAPGTLLVTVAGMLYIDADSTVAQSLTVAVRIGLCDTPDSDSDCGGTYSQVWSQDADDASSLNSTPAFILTRTVSVAASGPRVFYVNGEVPASPAGIALTLWQDPIVGLGPVATAMFFPGSLSVTRP